eukprot:scaffold208686_cov40-Tisochrysis_lutea.AAC.1
MAHLVEDLGPPVREVAVAQDEGLLACGKLSGDRLHGVGARACVAADEPAERVRVARAYKALIDTIHLE